MKPRYPNPFKKQTRYRNSTIEEQLLDSYTLDYFAANPKEFLALFNQLPVEKQPIVLKKFNEKLKKINGGA